MSGDRLRVRDQEGRPQQPDRPRGRRGASAAAVALVGDRRVPGRGAAVLGVAALRAAAATATRSSGCSSSAPPRKRSTGTCASRSRRCARRGGSSGWPREAAPGRARPRRGHRDRAGDAVGAAREVHRRGAVASARRRRTMADDTAAQIPTSLDRAAQRVARRERPRRRSTGATRCVRAARRAPRARAVDGGIEARLVYLQVVRARRHAGARRPPADPHDQAAGQARRISTATAACSPTASTPNDRRRSVRHRGSRRGRRAAVCGALDECDRRASGSRWPSGCARKRQFAYLARQVVARRGEARQRRWTAGRRLLQGEPPLLSEQGAGRARPRLCRRRQRRPRRARVDVRQQIRGQRGQDAAAARRPAHARRAAWSSRRPPGDALELTIDEYLQYIAERELRIGVEENSAAGGTAIIMDPHDRRDPRARELADVQPERLLRVRDDDWRRNRAIQDTLRARLDVQGRHRLGGARGEADHARPTRSTAIRATSRSAAASIHDTHHYGVLPFIDVIVKSSNVGAIKVGQRLGADRLGGYINRFGFGQVARSRLPRREHRDRLEPGAARSERARIGVDGLPGRRHAAADGDRGQRRRQRRRTARAARRPRRSSRTGAATKFRARSFVARSRADTAATLTEIMEAVVERGTAKKLAEIEGFTVAGKTGTASKLVNGRYSKTDYNASFVGFVPSRKPALTIVVVIDSPHAKGYYGGLGCRPRCSSGSPKRRFAISALARPSTRLHPCCWSRAPCRARTPLCRHQVQDNGPVAPDASEPAERHDARPPRPQCA